MTSTRLVDGRRSTFDEPSWTDAPNRHRSSLAKDAVLERGSSLSLSILFFLFFLYFLGRRGVAGRDSYGMVP